MKKSTIGGVVSAAIVALTLGTFSLLKGDTPLPIHGHPQKAAYNSPAEHPTFSAQTHLAERDVNPFFSNISDEELAVRLVDNTLVAHTHVDATCPYAAEVSEPFDCKFTLTAFHTDGRLAFFTFMYPFGHGVAEVGPPVWDETGSTTAPALVGDPVGVRAWTGHFTVTPTGFGWFLVEPEALTSYTNGSQTVTYLNVPIYSIADKTKPEEMQESDVNAASSGSSHNVPDGISFSGAIITRTYHPLGPISRWVQPFGSTPYGSAGIPEATGATLEQRRDMNLHAGDKGFSVESVLIKQNAEGTNIVTTEDINTMGGPGPHKLATIRYQQSGLVRMSTLLVENVVLDPAGFHSNDPVPAPIQVPAPTPTPTPIDTIVSPVFTLLADGVTLKTCVLGKCITARLQ